MTSELNYPLRILFPVRIAATGVSTSKSQKVNKSHSVDNINHRILLSNEWLNNFPLDFHSDPPPPGTDTRLYSCQMWLDLFPSHRKRMREKDLPVKWWCQWNRKASYFIDERHVECVQDVNGAFSFFLFLARVKQISSPLKDFSDDVFYCLANSRKRGFVPLRKGRRAIKFSDVRANIPPKLIW